MRNGTYPPRQVQDVLEEVTLKIVWLIADGLRRDHLACYGNTWLDCPNLQRLGEQARRFTRVRANRPECRTVRMELLSGLHGVRMARPMVLARALANSHTLIGQLNAAGYFTALLSDNHHTLPIYRACCDFDLVLDIPGQGDDPRIEHLDDVGPFETDERIPIAPEYAPKKDSLTRYARNAARYSDLGHPTQRLFEEAATAIKQLAKRDRSFILIDSFALWPPWDAPGNFAQYRDPKQLDKLAWLVPNGTPVDKVTDDQIRFCRCAYADACLFYDHALTPLLNALNEHDDIYLFVMSDHGILVGDHNVVGWNDETGPPAVMDQILMVLRLDRTGGEDESEVSTPDVYATTLALTGIESPLCCDGSPIKTLID